MSKVLYFITGESQRGIELALEDTENEVSILLMQNAVYFAQKTQGKLVGDAITQKKNVLVLKDDVDSRGIQNMLHDGVQLVAYDDVPDISFEHDTIINM